LTQGALVVDASALGDYLLGTAEGSLVTDVIVQFQANLHIPELCDVEVVAILRRALLGGELMLERAADALIDLVDLPLARHSHLASVGRILQLRDNFTSCDATYIALAEMLGAQFLTTDTPLARGVRAQLDLDVIDPSSD